MSMLVQCTWILWFSIGHQFTLGSTIKDANRCITKETKESDVFSHQYCFALKQDVNLFCPENEIIVLTSLQLAFKSNRDSCIARVLDKRNRICCLSQDNDYTYDSHCLQDVWNKEDRIHYQDFANEALRKCTNTSECVLKSQMFTNIQRRIPSSKKYSSYFQVVHQCIAVPKTSMNLCSSKSRSGKGLNILGTLTPGFNINKTCTCSLTTNNGGVVIVRAVDVRTSNSDLFLSSNEKVKNISQINRPVFGFREIFTDKKVSISLKWRSAKSEDFIWLHISGSTGQAVNVVCGEVASTIWTTTTTPRRVTAISTETRTEVDLTVFWGYWPLIYIAVGSLFTILIVACVLGSYFMCRTNKRNEDSGHHQCGYPSGIPPPDFYLDPSAHSYASVLDNTPHPDPPLAPCYTPEQDRARPPRTLTMSSNLSPRLPIAPATAATNPGTSYSRLSDVSRLEEFLKCKEPK